MSGKIYSDRVRYRLQLEAAPSATSGAASLLDGYFDAQLFSWMKLRLGQMKVPYSRQFLTSSAELQFPDTSSVVDAFIGGRELGGLVTFSVPGDRVELSAAIFNGNGLNRPTNDNSDHLFAARLAGNLIGKVPYGEADLDRSQAGLAAGLSAMQNTRNPLKAVVGAGGLPVDQLQASLTDDTLGADAAFRWQGLYATAEYHWRRTRSASAYQHARGAFVQAGYLVLDDWELAARGGVLTPVVERARAHATELQAQTNYYFVGHRA
jgi:phosphate-selective porin